MLETLMHAYEICETKTIVHSITFFSSSSNKSFDRTLMWNQKQSLERVYLKIMKYIYFLIICL